MTIAFELYLLSSHWFNLPFDWFQALVWFDSHRATRSATATSRIYFSLESQSCSLWLFSVQLNWQTVCRFRMLITARFSTGGDKRKSSALSWLGSIGSESQVCGSLRSRALLVKMTTRPRTSSASRNLACENILWKYLPQNTQITFRLINNRNPGAQQICIYLRKLNRKISLRISRISRG